MPRNLDGRVEAIFPLDSALLREAIMERVLKPILSDTVNTHELQSDGTYVRVQPQAGEQPFDSQAWFITNPLFEIEAYGSDTMVNTAISAIPSSA
jgi:polyphosphate kinase